MKGRVGGIREPRAGSSRAFYAQLFRLLPIFLILCCVSCTSYRTALGPGEDVEASEDGGAEVEVLLEEENSPKPELLVMSDNKVKIPFDFMLEIATGGGFTGIYQGKRVVADGRVFRWKTLPNAGPKSESTMGQLEPEAVSRIVQAIRNSDFFNTKIDQPGNMTFSIRAVLDGKSHAVRYAQPLNGHPSVIQPIVDAFMTEVESLEKTESSKDQ